MHPDSAPERRRLVGLAGHTGDPVTARAGLTDTESTVRVAALRALDRLGDLTDVELADGLADEEPAVRIAALEIAATRPGPPVAALLEDPQPMVVECAAWALGERANATSGVIDALARVARSHEDPLAREAAVAALGAMGDDRALPAILAATTDKPAVRRRAVIALAAFDGPEVDAAWARARHDRDRQVRDAVDDLLGPEES